MENVNENSFFKEQRLIFAKGPEKPGEGEKGTNLLDALQKQLKTKGIKSKIEQGYLVNEQGFLIDKSGDEIKYQNQSSVKLDQYGNFVTGVVGSRISKEDVPGCIEAKEWAKTSPFLDQKIIEDIVAKTGLGEGIKKALNAIKNVEEGPLEILSTRGGGATSTESINIGKLEVKPQETEILLAERPETPVEVPEEKVKVAEAKKGPKIEITTRQEKYDESEWLKRVIMEAGKEKYPDGGLRGKNLEHVSGEEFAWREFKQAYANEKRAGGLKTGQQIEDFQKKWFEEEFGTGKNLYAEAAKLKENQGTKTIVEITKPLRVGPVDLVDIHEENFTNLFRGVRYEFALKFNMPTDWLTNATIVDLYGINDENIPNKWGYKGDSIEFNPEDGSISFLGRKGPPPLAVIKAPTETHIAKFIEEKQERKVA